MKVLQRSTQERDARQGRAATLGQDDDDKDDDAIYNEEFDEEGATWEPSSALLSHALYTDNITVFLGLRDTASSLGPKSASAHLGRYQERLPENPDIRTRVRRATAYVSELSGFELKDQAAAFLAIVNEDCEIIDRLINALEDTALGISCLADYEAPNVTQQAPNVAQQAPHVTPVLTPNLTPNVDLGAGPVLQPTGKRVSFSRMEKESPEAKELREQKAWIGDLEKQAEEDKARIGDLEK